jgi:hypothetical protein
LAWEKAREKQVFTLPAIKLNPRRESKINVLRPLALARADSPQRHEQISTRPA